jgi:hypothetical protein
MGLAAGVDLKQVSVKDVTQPAAIRRLGPRLAVASRSDPDSSLEALRNIGDETKGGILQ